MEKIGDNTPSVGQRTGAKRTGEKSKDYECGDVLASRRPGVERRESPIGAYEQNLPPKEFGQWCPEELQEFQESIHQQTV